MSALSLLILGLLSAVPPASCQQGEHRTGPRWLWCGGLGWVLVPGVDEGCLLASVTTLDTCSSDRGAETGVMEEPPKAENSEPDFCLRLFSMSEECRQQGKCRV